MCNDRSTKKRKKNVDRRRVTQWISHLRNSIIIIIVNWCSCVPDLVFCYPTTKAVVRRLSTAYGVKCIAIFHHLAEAKIKAIDWIWPELCRHLQFTWKMMGIKFTRTYRVTIRCQHRWFHRGCFNSPTPAHMVFFVSILFELSMFWFTVEHIAVPAHARSYKKQR